MRSKLPTIKDIAKELNVSVSTVSRALRGMPEINEVTRKRIVDFAEKIDYQPNMVATSLVKRNSRLIGVLVPNMDYFFSTAVKGIDEAAMEAGYTVVISQSNESYGREVANIQRLMNSQVEGLIVSLSRETQNVEHFRRVQKKETPLVFFDRDFPGLEGSKVLLNNELGAELAVEHLIAQGCKRIAYLGGQINLAISNSREQGYKNALIKNGIEVKEDLILHGEFKKASAYSITVDLLNLPEPPDGIFAMGDRMALGAYTAIKEKGIRIPQDIALVGFNDEPIMKYVSPSISSVSQPAFEMGKMAARLFIEQLNSEVYTKNRLEIFKPKLIIRESSSKLIS